MSVWFALFCRWLDLLFSQQRAWLPGGADHGTELSPPCPCSAFGDVSMPWHLNLVRVGGMVRAVHLVPL